MVISLKQLFPQFNPETEQISDADFRNQTKINNLFQLLLEESTSLKLRFQGNNKTYSSCIIAVDIKNSLFTLDELHPVEGHKLIISTGNFIAQAIVKGVNISFHTSLIKTGRNGQFNCYECDIPNSIAYIQRRREYRVKVFPPQTIQITAQHKTSAQLLQGHIHDVSLKGVGVDFSTNQNTILKPGDYLTNCKLNLPKNESVGFTLEVRHIQSTNAGKIRIGGNFKDLTTRSEEIICRFVREMERAALKK